MNKGIFVTGTNTDIGKTFVSALILAAAHTQGISARYFKPIQTGSDCDCTTVQNSTGLANKYIIKPLFSFHAPQAPYRAALAENQHINIDTVVTQTQQLLATCPLIIEGAGGLLVPLTEKHMIRDLIKMLNLPTIIVASTKLGTINHTLLTIEATLAANISIAGLVLSGPPDPGLPRILQQFSSIPILADIPLLTSTTQQNFSKTAATLFPKELLTGIFA